MKEKFETIDFKIGNTSLDSIFKITIPDYGAPVPECHSHGPIPHPFYQSVRNIVNMINRGLHVQPSLEDSEKIYLFLSEYNREARRFNKEAGEEINPIADKAEAYFFEKMKFKYGKESREATTTEPTNPFAERQSLKPKVSNVYNSTTIQNTFKKKNKNQKPQTYNKIHKMYEMFSSPDAMTPDGSLSEVNIDKQKMNDMPSYMEDIDFSGVQYESSK